MRTPRASSVVDLIPLGVAVAFAYVLFAIRFWFFGPVLLAARSMVLFAASELVLRSA
jgi:hypothetical protein